MRTLSLLILTLVSTTLGAIPLPPPGPCTCQRNPASFHRDIVSDELIALVNHYFPSGGSPRDPTLISNAADPNIHFIGPGFITLSFAFEGAGYRNQLGYFTYKIEGGVPVILTQEIIVPDVSSDGNCLVRGDSVKIGPFAAGDNVGFYVVANGQCTPVDYVFTLDALNRNGQRQFGVFRDPATELVVLCIEDILLPAGDKDYEDVVYVIEIEGNIDDSGIPDVCLPQCQAGEQCVLLRDGPTCVPIVEPFNCGDGTTTNKPFGEIASLFNVLVFEGFKCKYSDTEGRLAAGGKIDLEGYSVGCKILNQGTNCINFGDVTCADLAAADEWADTVVGGGVVSWSHGECKTGNVVYGSTKSLNNVNIVSDCAARQDTVIDFAFQKNYLQSVSNVVKGTSSTGSVLDDYGSLIFQGTNADLEVFDLDAAKLAGAHGITFTGIKAGATVLVNVAGGAVSAGNFGFFNVNPAKTLWNFWGATSLTFHSIQWEGSVLAVNADINDPTGQINGQVFAKSWQGSSTGTCMQQNHVPFEGCVPNDDGGNIPPPPPPVCIEDCVNELFGATLYNGFIKEGFQCINSDVEGRLAAGGNVVIQSMGFGSCILVDHSSSDPCVNYQSCAPLGANRETLIAGGNIVGSVSNGVDAGDIVYGGSISGPVTTNGQGCTIKQQANFINFNAEFGKLSQLCSDLNGLAPTGTTTAAFGTVTFTGQGNLDLEVFNLQAATLNSANGLNLQNIKNKATVLINVKGAAINAANFGLSGFSPRYTLWNFCEASTITLQNVGWQGTILAPNAALNQLRGQIDGQVIAKSWTGGNEQCMELHEKPFAGCIPECF